MCIGHQEHFLSVTSQKDKSAMGYLYFTVLLAVAHVRFFENIVGTSVWYFYNRKSQN